MDGSCAVGKRRGGWRTFLAVVLAASLALGMTPLAATEAHAATKTKSYVYDVVYGTYQGKYAIGFKGIGSNKEEAHIISATDGVRIKVSSNDFGGDIDKFRSWTSNLTHAYEEGSYVSGVIGLPSNVKGSIKYTACTLEGKKLSKTVYDRVSCFRSDQIKGGAGTVLSRVSGNTVTADIFDSSGKKIQAISKTFPKGCSGRIFVDGSGHWSDGVTYLRLSAYSPSEGRDNEEYYVLKNGKFVKSVNPTERYNYEYLGNHVGDGIYLEDEWDRSTGELRYCLKHPNGKKVYLPRHSDNDRYSVAEDLGVYVINGGTVFVYDKNTKLLGTAFAGNKHMGISKSVIPDVWTSGNAAYNSSFQLIYRDSELEYLYIYDGGKLNGRNVYRLVDKSWQSCRYVDASLKPVTVGGCSLVSNYGIYAGNSSPIHTFKNGRQIAVAKNSSDKFGVVDTKGNVLIPFSYSDFYDSGSGDYIMMKKGKGWQFVKVSHLASGKAVKGGVYTVGKLKYKVTSTSKKSRTVTVVGHAKGKNASGKVSVPSTVKIGGQKFKVTAVGANAFKGSKVTSAAIGKYVKTIGSSAFSGCKSLKSVTLGASVKSVGKSAFSGCKKLSKVTVKSKSLKTVGKAAFKGIAKKAKFKVPASKVKAYKKILNSKAGVKKTMKITK